MLRGGQGGDCCNIWSVQEASFSLDKQGRYYFQLKSVVHELLH